MMKPGVELWIGRSCWSSYIDLGKALFYGNAWINSGNFLQWRIELWLHWKRDPCEDVLHVGINMSRMLWRGGIEWRNLNLSMDFTWKDEFWDDMQKWKSLKMNKLEFWYINNLWKSVESMEKSYCIDIGICVSGNTWILSGFNRNIDVELDGQCKSLLEYRDKAVPYIHVCHA